MRDDTTRRMCECAEPSEYLRADVDGWHCETCRGLVRQVPATARIAR